MHSWTKITYLGDTSLMAPAALIIGLWLLAARRQRLLFWWCMLLAFAMVLVAITKIAFIGWGIGIPALDFTGISGHSTFAMAVLPVLAFLLLNRGRGPLRIAGVGLALMLGLLVGLSRLTLGFHSRAEVVAGCVLGALVSLSFIWVAASTHHPKLNRTVVGVSLMLLVLASTMQAAPTQHWFVRVALYVSGHDQPYVRSRPANYSANTMRARRAGFFRFSVPECIDGQRKLISNY